MKICNSNYFLGNQILDISRTSFIKIRRILENIIKLDKPKIIKSYSWSRCLTLIYLLIKMVRKCKIKYRSIEILRIKKVSFLVFDFNTNVNYFSYNFPEKKKIPNISFVILHDVLQNHEIFINLLKIVKSKKRVNLNIFFFVKFNKSYFYQLMKCFRFENIIRKFY